MQKTAIPYFLLLTGFAYLAFPMLFSVQIEGFSAQIDSIAFLKSINADIVHDPYLPIVTQFITETRSFVIVLLTYMYKIWDGVGEETFRFLTLASALTLITCSVLFAKVWTNLNWKYSLFAIMLTPGVIELGFYFNDNIVSAALAAISLLLISLKTSNRYVVFSALFFTLATLSRIDAIFIGPIILGIILYKNIGLTPQIKAILIFGVSVLLIYLTHYFLLGFTLIDALLIAQLFILDISFLKNLILTKVYFLGLIIIPALAVGLFYASKEFIDKKNYILLISFIIYPILLFIFAPKATETRYIFPLLTPIIAMYGGKGFNLIYNHMKTNNKGYIKFFITTYIIASSIIFFMPPTNIQMKDGPRSITGRAWSPVVWLDWQKSVDNSMNTIDELLNDVKGNKTNVIISLHYNDEFYTRMKLIKSGYLPFKAQASYPSCNGFSIFENGKNTIFHIRTRPQYGIAPISHFENIALQISVAFKCEAVKKAGAVYIVNYTKTNRPINNAIFQEILLKPQYPQSTLLPFITELPLYGHVKYQVLNNEQLQNMIHNVNIINDQNPNKLSIDEYLRFYQPFKNLFN